VREEEQRKEQNKIIKYKFDFPSQIKIIETRISVSMSEIYIIYIKRRRRESREYRRDDEK
jgi:hypothetical protein